VAAAEWVVVVIFCLISLLVGLYFTIEAGKESGLWLIRRILIYNKEESDA